MVRLRSSAFEPRGEFPERYTCEGRNISPPLTWRDVPEEAKSLALVLDDPEAPSGPFTHWILYNIPPLRNELPENFSPGTQHAEGISQGRNDFGHARYEGPCPPAMGGEHNYHFRLYALDMELDLPSGANRDQLYDAIHDHILDETELVGVYGRSPGL